MSTIDMSKDSKTPAILYGTAFAFDDTRSLVGAALRAGFRAIDTAGSRGAYREEAVGQCIQEFIKSGTLSRDDLFIQTKFSPYKPGKDASLYPYEINQDIETQVQQSLQSSLTNLNVDYIDCLILHSLCESSEQTTLTWQAMERCVPDKVGSLGLSNTDLISLEVIHKIAKTKPCVVQNRFTAETEVNPEMPPGIHYPDTTYDRQVRKYCLDHDIKYTPWGILWSNPTLLDAGASLAAELGVTKEVVLYATLQALGFGILCGSKRESRLKENLQGLATIESFLSMSDANTSIWQRHVNTIKDIID